MNEGMRKGFAFPFGQGRIDGQVEAEIRGIHTGGGSLEAVFEIEQDVFACVGGRIHKIHR